LDDEANFLNSKIVKRLSYKEPFESLCHFSGKFSIFPSADGISTPTIYGGAVAAKVCA
jgi:hypothetical protein